MLGNVGTNQDLAAPEAILVHEPSRVTTRRGPWRGWRPITRHREVGRLPPFRVSVQARPITGATVRRLALQTWLAPSRWRVRALSWRSWACGAQEERRVRPSGRPRGKRVVPVCAFGDLEAAVAA
jgi:hypothetical protein